MVTGNIEVFTQNSIRIRGREGIIYVDPFQMREKPRDADYILITHDHYDHFSPEDIEKAAKAEKPKKAASKAKAEQAPEKPKRAARRKKAEK